MSLGITNYVFNDDIEITSDFSYEEIEKIDPIIAVGYYSLIGDSTFPSHIMELKASLIRKSILVSHPVYGEFINPEKIGESVNIIIQSPGGKVDIGAQLIMILNSLRSAGIKVNCYVSEAQSMAFSVMVTSCDKIVAKKDVILMQHRISYGKGKTTVDTFVSDIKLAYAEADALEIDRKEWLSITKTKEDKVFSYDEIIKYKLVDEWID
jgi:ATP-dependent protease ClpP protease subunit